MSHKQMSYVEDNDASARAAAKRNEEKEKRTKHLHRRNVQTRSKSDAARFAEHDSDGESAPIPPQLSQHSTLIATSDPWQGI